MAAKFEEAVEMMNKKVNKTLSNEELLELYKYFKQASVGDCNTERPGMLDFKGKAKWDAWNGLKGTMSKEDAMAKYVEVADQMAEKHGLIKE